MYSGEMVPAFERVLEVSAADADKLTNMMKHYKKVGYIRAHRRLYNLVKKYYHKDKVSIVEVISQDSDDTFTNKSF